MFRPGRRALRSKYWTETVTPTTRPIQVRSRSASPSRTCDAFVLLCGLADVEADQRCRRGAASEDHFAGGVPVAPLACVGVLQRTGAHQLSGGAGLVQLGQTGSFV